MRLPDQVQLPFFSTSPSASVTTPLPIDWEIPTDTCSLPINGTGGHVGYFDVEATPLRNFLYPALFDDELYPRGYRASIVWFLWKGSDVVYPTPDHPQEYLGEAWVTYTLDLVDERERRLMNVMPPTDGGTFLDCCLPGGHFDGTHLLDGWDFSNTSCKYLGLGALFYFWTIPSTLLVGESYRFQLSTNDSNVRYLSGEFRIAGEETDGWRTDGWGTGWGVGPGGLALGGGVILYLLYLLARSWRRR